jgi:hypothetical protein
MPVFADKVTLIMKHGKKVSGEIEKIEVSDADGLNKMDTTTINAASGTSEMLLKISEIKSIDFKSSDDVSCYEDSRFAPTRKVCTMKAKYFIQMKKPEKKKEKVEVTDDRMFYFYIKGVKEPVKFFLYKIKVTNKGREDKISYPELEREVLKHNKEGVKNILFK